MTKILSFIILLTSLTFGQSDLLLLFDDALPQPYSGDALFVLDGTIKTVGANKYFDDKTNNNRDFLITGYDFDSDWTVGFPYKSAATISAPAGDLALITADINHYLYAAADSTPNQIPVVSLFQDVDYGHRLFTRHAAQVLDGNLVETYQPRVLDVVLYANTKAGADLTLCQTYYGVSAEVLTAKWIDPVNGVDATGDGTKALPYKTFSKAISVTSSGGTIYIKTGDLNEACTVTNKGISIIGTGYTRNSVSGAVSAFYFTTNGTTANLVRGIICTGGAARGVYVVNSGNSSTYIDKMIITATNPLRATASVAGSVTQMSNSFTTGQNYYSQDNLVLIGNKIVHTAIAVKLYYNLTSKYNIYSGSSTTLIQRAANTTSILLFNDKITGSVLTDEAIATATDITFNYCNLYPNASGAFIALLNATNQVDFTFTNNTINQTLTTATTGFNIKCYDLVMDGNTILNQNSYIISATALAVSKTFSFQNNICTSPYNQTVYSVDYTFTADSNIMISETSSRFWATAVNYDNIPATISNNYMASKDDGNAFVYLGTEYSTAIDSNLNGSEVYNNRFSGPADWGGDIGGFHGLFAWSQSANWHHNYLSGTSLGFVLKSNGDSFPNAIYSNIVKNTTMSFTIKGIHGTLIYNNTLYDAIGYDGLAEDHVGTTGTSGNSTIKNNIFYDVDSNYPLIWFESTDDSAGYSGDYNLFYNAALTKITGIAATNKTLAEWQTLGYDANSLDTNPNFVSATQLWCTTPFDGETLDAAYDDGLDITTTWGSSTTVPHIVTKQQTGTWDVGAYVR